MLIVAAQRQQTAQVMHYTELDYAHCGRSVTHQCQQ
jgi:hypothetical protein